jgi:hypothetical protein
LRQPQGISDQRNALSAGVEQVLWIEEVIGVSAGRIQFVIDRIGQMPRFIEKLSGSVPGRPHFTGVRCATAHIDPISLGDIPRITSKIGVEKQLRLAVRSGKGSIRR